MKREKIIKNFEKMELLLIADFHLYNLIFAKEELKLDNFKASILLNLLWILLKANNPCYNSDEQQDENVLEQDDQFELHEKQEPKTLQNDIEVFRVALLNHSVHNPPKQAKYFNLVEIDRIIEHVHYSYIDKFNLYKYVFENKKKNEEVRLMVDISSPTIAAPLSDALYMGFDYQPIVEDNEDTQEFVQY